MSISDVVTISMFLSLALFIPATVSLSFDMSPIRRSDGGSLNLTGDAYVTDEGIQVTTNERDKAQVDRAGRATYIELLHLWDNTSKKLADFSTHFSMVIDSLGRDNFGDGLTFFLAPKGSTIKKWSYGGSLGLRGAGTSVDSSSLERFVAVEFDTYPNGDIDPPYYGGTVVPHVGIDLNNVSSVAKKTWYNNITAGWENDAWISYNSSTKILKVDFTGKWLGETRRDNLSYEVDLRHYLPEYVTVGFSAATGASFEKNNVKSWKFSSTDLSSNKDQPSPSPQPQVVVNDSKSPNNKRVFVFGLVGAVVLLLVLTSTFIYFFLSSKKKKEKEKHYEGLEEDELSDSAMDDEFEKGNGPKRFSYNELVLATNDFEANQKLGEGGFGSVYRGFLQAMNTYVAVKKVSETSKQGRKEYEAEVKIISQLRHINLVELIGWCHRRKELLLVYEFMPNGSLDSHLFKANSLLTWEMRYKIAQGLASALLYLHVGLRQYVVHRDIKSSNVMLDNNFNAKLGDFGLARLVDHDKNSHSTIPAGTLGYMAPEYLAEWRASKETDIYSLGIVLLEIASGRRPIDHRYPQNQIVLVEWVWNLYGAGEVLDAADPKLDSSESDIHKIERLMVVGLWCVHPDSGRRPSIRQVIQVLISEDRLPELPLAMPKAKYDTLEIVTKTSSSTSTDPVIYAQRSNSSNLTTSSAGSTSDNLLPR